MNENFVCYDKFFTSEECDNIITLAKDIEELDAKIGTTNNFGEASEVRRSVVKWIDRIKHGDNFEWLFQKMNEITAKVNNQYFDIDYRYDGCVAFQYTIYHGHNEGWYDQHMDHFMPGSWPDARKISFTVQLTDPEEYEGGELSFRDTGGDQPPEFMKNKGSVCFFPSIQYHGVSPVTSGTRTSLVGWYRGPQWR